MCELVVVDIVSAGIVSSDSSSERGAGLDWIGDVCVCVWGGGGGKGEGGSGFGEGCACVCVCDLACTVSVQGDLRWGGGVGQWI